jgi:hypothetical protein
MVLGIVGVVLFTRFSTRTTILMAAGVIILGISGIAIGATIYAQEMDKANATFEHTLKDEYGATSSQKFSDFREKISVGSIEAPATFTRDGVATKVLIKNVSESKDKAELVFYTIDEKTLYPKK